MRPTLTELHPQYIIDEQGRKKAVILDIKNYEKLLEEIEDIYLGLAAQEALQEEQELISHEDIKRNLSE